MWKQSRQIYSRKHLNSEDYYKLFWKFVLQLIGKSKGDRVIPRDIWPIKIEPGKYRKIKIHQ